MDMENHENLKLSEDEFENKKIKLVSELVEYMSRNHVEAMSVQEYENCSIVVSSLEDEYSFASFQKTLSIEDVIFQAIKTFELYRDVSFQTIIFDILKHTSIQVESTTHFPPIVHFQSKISPQVLIENEKNVIPSIIVPDVLDILSPYYLSHEFHHILKDQNSKEYQYKLRYSDVIPQLYELIACENDLQTQRSITKNRLSLLSQMKSNYFLFKTRQNRTPLWDFYDSKNCQYFNCFYYSILLYYEYQEHPQRVLREISRVLKQDITTYQLLESFGMFEKNFHSEVESGIQYLKKSSI